MTERIILRRPVTAREYTAFENRASAAGVEKVGMIENTIMLSSIVPGFFILPKGTDATENEWGGVGGSTRKNFILPASSAFLETYKASGHSKICDHSNVHQNFL